MSMRRYINKVFGAARSAFGGRTSKDDAPIQPVVHAVKVKLLDDDPRKNPKWAGFYRRHADAGWFNGVQFWRKRWTGSRRRGPGMLDGIRNAQSMVHADACLANARTFNRISDDTLRKCVKAHAEKSRQFDGMSALVGG